jgi:hypothetical protein
MHGQVKKCASEAMSRIVASLVSLSMKYLRAALLSPSSKRFSYFP